MKHEKKETDAQPSVGLLDLGSNSIRLLVFRVNPNKSYTVLTRHKQMIRLGEGAFSSRRLSEEAMERAFDAIRNMAEMCRGYNVEDIVAYATAAVRDADNGADFVSRAASKCGIRFVVISGLEEARLIHIGVSTGLSFPYERCVFVDIGGGSTELMVGDKSRRCLYMDSLKLGSVRVADAFPETSDEGSVSYSLYEKIRNHVRNSSFRSVFSARALGPDAMVGSSGTIQNLAEIASRMSKNAPPEGGGELPESLEIDALADLAKKLCSLTLAERKKLPGINPSRADIIVAGAAILHTIMDEIGAPSIRISARGLLEGMLQDYLERGRLGYLDNTMTTREQSVLQLARSCNFNETHSRHVALLACGMFDTSREIGLHGYGPRERELLGYAALLHDIGLFLSFGEHHTHSRYMIINSELLGFDQREIAVMGNAAYFHRKWTEKKNRSDEMFNQLSRDDRKTALVLGLFLRMGEGLDRSQQQTVKSARVEGTKHGVILRLSLLRPSPMELYSIEKAASQFKKTFGREYTIVI
ncbi:MAG: Ppx/GppA family phosphatase [Synergistaceae bacterium]|jgi:exopolyphosphatase/guanosine-5'-triphosphate,3'-diphosphate pyrophosphatase|nr:Ppx/GppA family phosphatase [Synergistaceae bacterium]